MFKGIAQGLDAHAFAGGGRNLEGTQSQFLYQLQEIEIGRRLDCNCVTGTTGNAQREGDRFNTAGGYDDFIGTEGAAGGASALTLCTRRADRACPVSRKVRVPLLAE